MVSKAVIPVAGFGTRMLPASKSIPKEMLPVVDRPAIQYVVEEAIRAGLTEIILVTHGTKGAIEHYFDGCPELEAHLSAKGETALLREVREPLPEGVQVVSVRQGPRLGLGHAVYAAHQVVGNEPFVVMLPDVLVDAGAGDEDLSIMIGHFRASGHAQVMVEAVPEARVERYGIVKLGGASDTDSEPTPARGETAVIRAMVEKPRPVDAPSNLAVVGRYVLPARMMGLLARTPPGAGGEIQLTDAIATLMEHDTVEAYVMHGETFDCGSKAGYLEAILHYALKRPELADATRALLDRHRG